MEKQAATIITQTLVDKNDTAFQNPSKPIGSFMEESDARRHKEDEGWAVVEDAGRGWRRVVPSPIPQRIIEADVINDLIQQSYMVISVGGGGIPVIEREDGSLAGVEAVIDKDFSSAVLANSIQAD
jgi:carbamate kinase